MACIAAFKVIEATDDTLHVQIEDNGSGFEPALGLGSGLGGLRDRLEAVGGTLGIDSRRDAGTRLSAWLPSRQGQVGDG